MRKRHTCLVLSVTAADITADTKLIYSGAMAAGSICMPSQRESANQMWTPVGLHSYGASHDGTRDRRVAFLDYADSLAASRSSTSSAACAVCQRPGALQNYVQWGNGQSCTSGHQTEYMGNLMFNAHTTACIDRDQSKLLSPSASPQSPLPSASVHGKLWDPPQGTALYWSKDTELFNVDDARAVKIVAAKLSGIWDADPENGIWDGVPQCDTDLGPTRVVEAAMPAPTRFQKSWIVASFSNEPVYAKIPDRSSGSLGHQTVAHGVAVGEDGHQIEVARAWILRVVELKVQYLPSTGQLIMSHGFEGFKRLAGYACTGKPVWQGTGTDCDEAAYSGDLASIDIIAELAKGPDHWDIWGQQEERHGKLHIRLAGWQNGRVPYSTCSPGTPNTWFQAKAVEYKLDHTSPASSTATMLPATFPPPDTSPLFDTVFEDAVHAPSGTIPCAVCSVSMVSYEKPAASIVGMCEASGLLASGADWSLTGGKRVETRHIRGTHTPPSPTPTLAHPCAWPMLPAGGIPSPARSLNPPTPATLDGRSPADENYADWVLRSINHCKGTAPETTFVSVDSKAGYACFKGAECVAPARYDKFAQPEIWSHDFAWDSNRAQPRMLADVNGDGRADVVGFAAHGVYVSLSSGAGFDAAGRWAMPQIKGEWEHKAHSCAVRRRCPRPRPMAPLC